MYNPGDTIQPSPIYDETNFDSNIYITLEKQYNRPLFMMIETLIRINISPRGHNTTISPIYCFLSNCLYYCIPHITRQRERGRNPSDRTRSDSHLLHLNCRVCPLELSLSLHSTVNQDITPSEGNALTVRKSHL